MAAPTVSGMATLPNPLPRLDALGLELPPGRLVDETDEGPWHEPLLWLAAEQAVPGAWDALRRTAPAAGLLPVLVEAGGDLGGPWDWELAPGEVSYPGDHDPVDVLAEHWEECAADGEEWPGPAPAADVTAPEAAASALAEAVVAGGTGSFKEPRLALVPARRSADIPAAIGWTGPANHDDDVARLCAVLRSWEDRYGIRVVALGFAHLLVSVAAPPATLAEARALAAEHFAFCPDTVIQGPGTLTEYAEQQLLGKPSWHFWWD
ncbi:uncharacterized protein DUF4253 [Streptomyces sp. SLBN-31]|nr:uncharacterized protein DUF4253 [Streptomyces sp. SLBN-31]